MSRYITTADVHQKCKLKHQQDKTQNSNYTQYPQSYHSQKQVSELTARCFSYTYPCSCHINGTYCIVTALSQLSQIPQLKREADLLSVQISHNYNGATLANILTIFVRRMLLFRHQCNLNSAKQYTELHVPLSVGLDTHLVSCPPVPSPCLKTQSTTNLMEKLAGKHIHVQVSYCILLMSIKFLS